MLLELLLEFSCSNGSLSVSISLLKELVEKQHCHSELIISSCAERDVLLSRVLKQRCSFL